MWWFKELFNSSDISSVKHIHCSCQGLLLSLVLSKLNLPALHNMDNIAVWAKGGSVLCWSTAMVPQCKVVTFFTWGTSSTCQFTLQRLISSHGVVIITWEISMNRRLMLNSSCFSNYCCINTTMIHRNNW